MLKSENEPLSEFHEAKEKVFRDIVTALHGNQGRGEALGVVLRLEFVSLIDKARLISLIYDKEISTVAREQEIDKILKPYFKAPNAPLSQ